jgi:hypothetical protein
MDVVHINTATCKQLLNLPGVGSRVAQAITDRRTMLGCLTVADLETIPHLRLTPYLLARIDFSPPSGAYDWFDSDPDLNGRVANYHCPSANAQQGSEYGDGQGEDRGGRSGRSSNVSSCLTESSRYTQQWEGPVVDSKSRQDSNRGQRGDNSLRYADSLSETDTFNNSCVGDGQIGEECLDYSRMSRIRESSPNYSRMSRMEYHSPDYFSQTRGASPGDAGNRISGLYSTPKSMASVQYTPGDTLQSVGSVHSSRWGTQQMVGSVQCSPGGAQQSVGSVQSSPGGSQQSVGSVQSSPGMNVPPGFNTPPQGSQWMGSQWGLPYQGSPWVNIQYPGYQIPFPGAQIPFPGAQIPFPGAQIPFPGAQIPFPGVQGTPTQFSPGGTQQTVGSVQSLPGEIEMVGGRGVLYPNMAQWYEHNIQYLIH